MLDLNDFPEYFMKYSWNAKHALYGYPADRYDSFEWILSLEKRFKWLRGNFFTERTASIYLIKEMIQWGGSQNGVLQKFEDGMEQHNMRALMENVIANILSPKDAISDALDFPGMGLSYASKMLRFLDPERYGALDSRIRDALGGKLGKIYDANKRSMIIGFVTFTELLDDLKQRLDQENIKRPDCQLPVGSGSAQWRAADIEMALFGWASHKER